MKYFIGVDPGKNGGIAVLQEDGKTHTLIPIPDTERDIWQAIDDLPHGQVLIELVHSMPARIGPKCNVCKQPRTVVQGVVGVFSFGRSYGFLRACLTAAELPFTEIPPHVWQKFFSIPSKRKFGLKYEEHKRVIKQKAQQLFPTDYITLKTCDALLIAELARRKYLNLKS